MISVNNVTLAYGKRVLFDEVNINFVKGNCYGIIGANGAGKSTFLKIISGEIDPNKGTVSITPGERMAVLAQNQNAFDDVTVLNTVLMGHKHMWEVMQMRNCLNIVKEFVQEEDAVGVVEIILILVVLISLVIIFKEQLTSLVNSILSKITKQSNSI